jgi:hypothetical protein
MADFKLLSKPSETSIKNLLGKLTDVRKKETSYSTPFSFPEFDPHKI